MKRVGLMALFAGTALLSGCGQAPPETKGRPAGGLQWRAPAASVGAGGIQVLDAAGHLLFRLRGDIRGYQLFGKDDQLLAQLTMEFDRIKVVDRAGKTLLKLKYKDRKCKAEDDSGAVLFTLKPYRERDYKVEDPSGETLYRLKKEDYGYKISDAENQTLYKMKLVSDSVIAEGPDGVKKMEVKGSEEPLAAGALLLESLDLPHRCALFAYLSKVEGTEP